MTYVYILRSEWGSADTRRNPFPGALPELYIHHVGGPAPAPTFVAESAHMRALQQYAITGKGYSDLDYNVIVGRSGLAYEGRGFGEKSAATLDRNLVSRSICVMGNYQTDQPTPEQLDTIVAVGRAMIAAGVLAPNVVTRGHRDNPSHYHATVCPGNNLYPEVAGVAARIVAPSPPTPPKGSTVENVMLSIAGRLAIFRAFIETDTGAVVLAEWSGPGGDPKTDAMLARFAHLPKVTRTMADLSTATLLGPLPVGDSAPWSDADWFRHAE